MGGLRAAWRRRHRSSKRQAWSCSPSACVTRSTSAGGKQSYPAKITGLLTRSRYNLQVGGTARSRQRANGEPRFLCRAFPGCRERPVHHADVLVCLQRHACRLESSSSVKVSLIIKHRLLILILFCDSPGCQVESFPCERKTLETQKKLQGNFMCWKGSKGYSPYTSLCPYYR